MPTILTGIMSTRKSKQRRIRDERAARACLAALAREGTDLATWARTNGYSARSLNAWRINLERRTQAVGPSRVESGAKRSALVELVPANHPSSGAHYVLEVGGIRLEVGGDFSEPSLRRLLEVLRSC